MSRDELNSSIKKITNKNTDYSEIFWSEDGIYYVDLDASLTFDQIIQIASLIKQFEYKT
jgi:hypothetical protein